MHNFIRLKKRTFKKAFGEFKEHININNNIELDNTKKKCVSKQDKFDFIKLFKELKIEDIKKNQFKWEDFLIYLNAKIFTKSNYYYIRYLENVEYKKGNKSKQHNKEQKKVKNKNEKKFILDDNSDHNSSEENKDNNNNNNNDPENVKISETSIILSNYINEPLYPIVRNFKDINPINIEIKDVGRDGNCMFRALSQFIYGNEYMHQNIRQKIFTEAMKRLPNIPNIIMETEMGNIRIHDYIKSIKENSNFGGDFELSIAYDIFNINIAEYIEIRESNGNLINLSFVKYINDNNDEKKNLLILTNLDHNYFRLAYYNNTEIDYEYNYINNINNEKEIKIEIENKENSKDNNIDSKKGINQKEYIINLNEKYKLKDISNLNLEEILKYYNDDSSEKQDNLADIYYYIYHYNNSENKSGKYSKNFEKKYKGANIRAKKNAFKKRIKNYNIAQDKKLMKFVNIKNKDTNLEEFNNLIVVPIKERNKLLEFYHRITGHRNYLILYDKIISENYYWNNITLS